MVLAPAGCLIGDSADRLFTQQDHQQNKDREEHDNASCLMPVHPKPWPFFKSTNGASQNNAPFLGTAVALYRMRPRGMPIS